MCWHVPQYSFKLIYKLKEGLLLFQMDKEIIKITFKSSKNESYYGEFDKSYFVKSNPIIFGLTSSEKLIETLKGLIPEDKDDFLNVIYEDKKANLDLSYKKLLITHHLKFTLEYKYKIICQYSAQTQISNGYFLSANDAYLEIFNLETGYHYLNKDEIIHEFKPDYQVLINGFDVEWENDSTVVLILATFIPIAAVSIDLKNKTYKIIDVLYDVPNFQGLFAHVEKLGNKKFLAVKKEPAVYEYKENKIQFIQNLEGCKIDFPKGAKFFEEDEIFILYGKNKKEKEIFELYNSNTLQKITSMEGIEGIKGNSIFKLNGNIVIGTEKNIFILNKATLETIKKIELEGKLITLIALKNEDFLYFDSENKKFILLGKDSNYSKIKEFKFGNDYNNNLYDLGNGKIIGNYGSDLIEIYNY